MSRLTSGRSVERVGDGTEYRLVVEGEGEAEEKSLWEIFPDDLDDSDLFQRSIIGLLNRAVEIKGRIGYWKSLVGALWFGISSWWKGDR